MASTAAVAGVAFQLALYLIKRYQSDALADKVAARVSPPPSRSVDKLIVPTDPHAASDVQLVAEIQAWFRQHYTEQIQVSELVVRFGLSYRKLLRLFEAATGQTPLAHLQQLRVAHAKQLLHSTDLPMIDVVRQSGYLDKSVFSELFRRYENITPHQYRKRCQQ